MWADRELAHRANLGADTSLKLPSSAHTQFGVTMKVVRLIMKCLNEKYNKVRVGKCLSNFVSTIV
jgi:hypothetical protein